MNQRLIIFKTVADPFDPTCVIGEQALNAAGAVVMEGMQVPPHTLWAGCPARKIKDLTDEQLARMACAWKHYVNNGQLALARFGRQHIEA